MRSRRILAVALAAVALVSASLTVPSVAKADSNAIGGTITTDDGPLKTTLYFELDRQVLDSGDLVWQQAQGGAVGSVDTFAFPDQPPGDYRVVFYGDHVYYDAWTSDTVSYSGSGTLDFSHEFHTYDTYSISGTVTPAAANATITPYYDTGSGWAQGGFASTNASGQYSVVVRTDRAYRLLVKPESGSGYRNEAYPNVEVSGDDIADATGAVAVDASEPTGKDVALVSGSAIRGTITAATPVSPSYPESVQVLNAASPFDVVKTVVAMSSDYLVDGLAAGDYLVRFVSGAKSGDAYAQRVTQFYDDVDTTSATAVGVETVHIADADTRTGIDADLSDAPHPVIVDGAVTLHPASGAAITVELDHLDGADWVRDYIGTAPTGGHYSAVVSTPGVYRFVYSAPGYTTRTSESFGPGASAVPDWDVTLEETPFHVAGTIVLSPVAAVTPTATLERLDVATWTTVSTTASSSYEADITGTATYRYVYAASGYGTVTSAEFTKASAKPDFDVTLKAAPATTGAQPSPVIAALTFAKRPTPVIHGTVRAHKKVKATVGSFAVAGVHLAYRWYANGKAIPKATRSTYTIGAKYRSKKLTVRVTATKPGYVTLVRTSKAAKIR